MNGINKTAYLLGAFLLLPFQETNMILAQDCTSKLTLAEELYREGLVERLPGILFPCLEDGFTSEQRVRAYKLLIHAYYYDDAMDEATQTMRHFVKLYPDYRIDSADTQEFTALFESFQNRIFLGVGLKTGSYYPFPTSILNSSSSLNDMILNDSYEFLPYSSHFGLGLEIYLAQKTSVSVEISYSRLKFRNMQDINPGGQRIHLDYREKLQFIEIPVIFNYHFSDKRLQPYLSLGGHTSYMLDSEAEIQFRSSQDAEAITDLADLTDQRFKIGLGISGGAGAKYFMKKGYLFVHLAYSQGLAYMIKDNAGMETDLRDNDLLWNYLYSGRNFRMSRLDLSLGYSLYFNRITRK